MNAICCREDTGLKREVEGRESFFDFFIQTHFAKKSPAKNEKKTAAAAAAYCKFFSPSAVRKRKNLATSVCESSVVFAELRAFAV